MSKKYRQDADVQLIPYYEYDPSIHNVEYRYIPQQSAEGFQDFNYNSPYNQSNDWWRQPYLYPRPWFGPYGYHGPYGPFGFHPWGYHHVYPHYGGWHGWHYESSPSR